MKEALRVPVFRRLLAAYALNELTWSFGTIALAVLIYRRTGSALGSTAFFLCSQFAPALVSPFLVARLAHVNYRRVLPVLYAVEGALFGLLAYIAHHFSLGPMLAVTLIDGIVALTARAMARTPTVEVMRPVDLLHEGNAIINLVFSVCFMVGPAIGGLVVAAGGTATSLLVNCALFVLIALLLAVTALPPAHVEDEDRGLTVRQRLRAAANHTREDRALRWLLILQTLGMAAFTISIPVEVVFAQHTVHAGAGGYGAMLSGWGAGAIAGSAIFARYRRLPGRVMMATGGFALAVGFAIIAAAPTIVLAVIGSIIGGAGNGTSGGAIRTALQEYTARRWMNLMMSFSESLAQAAPGLGFVLGGVLAALTDPRVAMAVAAAGSLAYTVATWTLLRPALIGEPLTAEEVESGRGGRGDTVRPEHSGSLA